MAAFGVSETEWRAVSNSASEVDGIRRRYDRILQAVSDLAKVSAQYVTELSVEVNAQARSGIVKSFAGESNIRLAWRVRKGSVEGVFAVTTARLDGAGANEVLHVFIPSDGGAYLMLESGETLGSRQVGGEDFAYTVLMTIVRKQVDLSSQV